MQASENGRCGMCGEATGCGDVYCGHLCPTHEAQAEAAMRAEADSMRCGRCGRIHDDAPNNEGERMAALEACGRVVETRRAAAREAAEVRGFRSMMRAAQAGAPERYRW